MSAQDAPNPQTEATATPPRKRRGLRLLLAAVAALLLLVVAFVLLLPTILSTASGNDFVVQTINNNIPGRVALRDLSLSWTGGQSLSELSVSDPDGQTVLTADRVVASDLSLLSVLTGNRAFGQVTVDKPVLALKQYEDGSTNLQRALSTGQPQPQQQQQPMQDLSVDVTLNDGRVTYDAPDMTPVAFNNVQLAANVKNLRLIDVALQTQVQQNSDTGRVEGKVTITDLFNAQGELAPAGADVQADVQITDLPVVVADRLLEQGGALVELLGPGFTGAVKIAGDPANFNGNVVANTANLKVNAAFQTQNNTLVFSPDSTLRARVEPSAWAKLTAPAPPAPGEPTPPPAATLAKPFEIALNLQRLTIPRRGEAFDVANASVEAQLNIGDIVLDTGERAGRVELRQTTASVAAKRLAESVQVNLNTTAAQGTQTGRVQLAATLRDLLTADGGYNAQGMSTLVKGSVADLPLAVVDEFAGTGNVIVQSLGPVLQANVDANIPPAAPGQPAGGTFTVTAQSQNMNARLVGQASPKRLVASDQSQVTLTLTTPMLRAVQDYLAKPDPATAPPAGPAAPQPAQPRRPVSLAEPARLVLNVTALDVPLENFDLRNVIVGFRGSIDRLVFAGDERVAGSAMSNVSVVLPTTRLGEKLVIEFGADVADTAQPQGQPGSLRARADVQRPLDENRAIAATAQGKAVPVQTLDTLAQQNGQLVNLLGNTADFTASAQFVPRQPSPVDVDIASSNVTGQIKAVVSPENVLVLREPAVVRMRITEAMSRSYLSTLNPILTDVSSTGQPATVRIAALEAPLTDFDVKDVKADMTLDLDELTVRRGNMATGLVGALNSVGARLPDREVFPARFTTLRVNMSNGVIQSNDLWMLATGLTLGSKGVIRAAPKAAAPGQSAWVADLVLGISANTLAMIPGLKDAVVPGAVYELPVTGPVNALKPDWGKFIKDIGLIKAEAEVKRLAQREGGAAGGLLGDLAGGLIGGVRNPGQKAPQLAMAGWPNKPEPPEPAAAPQQPQQPGAAQPGATQPPPGTISQPAPDQPKQAAPQQPAPRDGQQDQQAQPAPAPQPEPDPIGGLLQGLLRERQERERQKQQREQQRREQQQQSQ